MCYHAAMEIPERVRKIGLGITFWTALAVLYPTVKVLELCDRVYTRMHARVKKERT